jgi:hypothetical protein
VISVVRNLLLLAVAISLALPAVASASSNQVIRDCAEDGTLDHNYSTSELRKALGDLPSDLDEYSDCREVIGGAIKGGSDKGGGRATSAGAAGGGQALTPEEQQARAKDQADLDKLVASSKDNPPVLKVGGKTLKPGSNGLFDLASASNGLPAPLVVALIALALLAMTGGFVALRERVPALARIPILSKIPTPRVSFPRFRR